MNKQTPKKLKKIEWAFVKEHIIKVVRNYEGWNLK